MSTETALAIGSASSCSRIRAAHKRHARLTRTVAWLGLLFALTANVADAVELIDAYPLATKGGVAVVGPVFMMAALHMVTDRPEATEKLGRNVPGRARVDGFLVAQMIVLIGGFALSYEHLYALAVAAGVPVVLAWLFPVVIDATALLATVDLRRSKQTLELIAGLEADAAQADTERLAAEQRAAQEAAIATQAKAAEAEARRTRREAAAGKSAKLAADTRRRQVVEGLRAGRPMVELAQALGVSTKTIERDRDKAIELGELQHLTTAKNGHHKQGATS